MADVRRELTRQRNVAGGRRGVERTAAAQAMDRLTERDARARPGAPRPPTAASDEIADDLDVGASRGSGLWGRSRTLGSSGRIVEISGRTGRITLQTDEARIVVPSDDVEVVDEPISGPPPRDEEAEALAPARRGADLSHGWTCAASASRRRSSG